MSQLLAQLLAETDPVRQRALVDAHVSDVDDALLSGLKSAAAQRLRSDVHATLALADLMLYAAEKSGSLHHRALGLLIQANAFSLGGLGQYARAVDLYEEASSIYRKLGRAVDEANAQISFVLALANLGRYDEAVCRGNWAARVLEEHGEWFLLGKLTANLGNIQYRRGEDAAALAMFDRAAELYRSLGDDPIARSSAGRIDNNRSVVLRDLGRFDEAIAASTRSLELLVETNQAAEVARSQQNLAVTYFILNRYNEALALLAKSQAFFEQDGRPRDAILAELFIGNCLLQLRRFGDVLDKSERARELFARFGTHFEMAQALLNQATACAGLGRYDDALDLLAQARATFGAEGNGMWVAFSDLESAEVLQRVGRHAESLALVVVARRVLHDHGLPVEEAEAGLTAARAAFALGDLDHAATLLTQARAIGEQDDLPAILYPYHHLQARLAEKRGELDAALKEVARASRELERLRRQLMIEHRVDFLEDKGSVYEDAVALCMELGRPAEGLAYAERAKSRALLELLDYRINIGIEARSAADLPVVEELLQLRSQRDLLYRRWEGSREINVRGWVSPGGGQREVQAQVLGIERRITELWHRLLVSNAAYAGDAELWGAFTASALPSFPDDTLLLEYFVARGRLILFVMAGSEVRALPLAAAPAEVQQLFAMLQVNLRTVAGRSPAEAQRLAPNAMHLLRRLYDALLRPLATADRELLARRRRLIVVPSGWLHYLPFHALHDGAHYLAETHEVTYMPGASLLRHVAAPAAAAGQPLALGISYNGRLPNAPNEARAVAELLGGNSYLEDAATIDVLRGPGAQAPALHLATHGEFRPDNPLFSGLALAGAWLTTLDIFGLRLAASLVTLSACHTGRSVVGGGDELLGLARAFLSAGAASIMLTLWAVEDRSTAEFMVAFYRGLAAGQAKSAALRAAQTRFIADTTYAHPYFWAPFLLIGHQGGLHEGETTTVSDLRPPIARGGVS